MPIPIFFPTLVLNFPHFSSESKTIIFSSSLLFFFFSQFLLFPLIIHYCLVFYSYNLCACVLSCFSFVWLFVTLQTRVLQSPLSMGFSKQDYWVGCHALLQGIFLTQGSNASLLSPALLGRFFTTSATWEALIYYWPGSKYSAFLKTNVQSNIC